MDSLRFQCPVCGYLGLLDVPHSYGGGGSYEICPSCGFQFGVSDDDQKCTYDQWRKRWMSQGYPWSSTGIRPPPGWDPHEQLRSAERIWEGKPP